METVRIVTASTRMIRTMCETLSNILRNYHVNDECKIDELFTAWTQKDDEKAKVALLKELARLELTLEEIAKRKRELYKVKKLDDGRILIKDGYERRVIYKDKSAAAKDKPLFKQGFEVLKSLAEIVRDELEAEKQEVPL